MSELELVPQSAYPQGTFCWLELGTPDQQAAKRFYAELFGWEVLDIPLEAEGEYSMLRRNGEDVAALYSQDPRQRAAGVPPSWLAYLSVASVDESAARALSLGAFLLVEPMDVLDYGRMAVLRDPTGAVVALWEAREHRGAGMLDQPGALCWVELHTPEPARAREFYTALLGWSTEEMEIDCMPYTVFKRGGESAGGMMRPSPGAESVPARWMPYLAVESTDEVAARAEALGAGVVVPPTDIPGIGRFATLRDPQGAVLSVLGG